MVEKVERLVDFIFRIWHKSLVNAFACKEHVTSTQQLTLSATTPS